MPKTQIAAKATEISENLVYIATLDTHEILYMNDRTLSALKLPADFNYSGQKCYRILQGKDSPCDFCTNSQLCIDKAYHWNYYNPIIGGHFLASDKLIDYDGRLVRFEVATEITQELREQEQLRERLGIEETLIRGIQILSEYPDIQEAVGKLLEAVMDFYQGDRGYIFEFDYTSETADNTYEWCRKGISSEIERLKDVPLEELAEWIEKFQDKGEFYITSLEQEVEKDAIQYQKLDAQNIKSLIAAPMIKDGVITGFIGVDNPRIHTNALGLLKSITYFIIEDFEKRELLEMMEHMSFYDMLTQVYNRNKYARVLRELAGKAIASIGIVYMDLNGLKMANDTYGHNYGDYLIKSSAIILKTYFKDNIFRLGGDEFLVLCMDMEQDVFEDIVGRFREEVNQHKEINASIGSIWTEDTSDLEEQIAYADELMYADKQSYYKSNLISDYNRSIVLTRELLESIARGDFVVYLQPKVELDSGRLTGAEALVRKQNADGSLIMPDWFISQYESEHIIRHIDLFVLEKVCSTLKSWRERGRKMIRISINFSRITLMENHIVQTIKEICDSYRVESEYIDIEMKESIGKMRWETLEKLTREFKSAGFSISLDDFGAQYSNLAILSSMEFNNLKLDKNLVRNIERNEKSRIIVEHAISLCREFKGTTSVAEGIETEQQLQWLHDSRCDVGQGYYFSRPLTIREFSDLYMSREESGLPFSKST